MLLTAYGSTLAREAGASHNGVPKLELGNEHSFTGIALKPFILAPRISI
jgi:hypothetical protein